MLRQKLIEIEHRYNLATNKYISKSDFREGLILIFNSVNNNEESLKACKAAQKIPISLFYTGEYKKEKSQKEHKLEKEIFKDNFVLDYFNSKQDPDIADPRVVINCKLSSNKVYGYTFGYDLYYKEWFMLKLDFVKWLQVIKNLRGNT